MVRKFSQSRAASKALAASVLLSGASAASLTTTLTPATTISTMKFNGIPINYPADQPAASTSATINGVPVTFPGYNAIYRSGFKDTNNVVAGQLIDKLGNPIYAINDTMFWPAVTCTPGTAGRSWTCPTGYVAGSMLQNALTNAVAPTGATFATCSGSTGVQGCATAVATTIPEISNDPDYTSLMAVGGNLYSITQFESPSPSVMYLSQLQKNADGSLALKPGTLTAINWASFGGIMATCAGSTTPWNSHLGSEESVVADGRDFAGTFFGTVSSAVGYNTVSMSSTNGFSSLTSIARYFGFYPNQLTASVVMNNINPYRYGYITEVKVTGPGAYTTAKHFWMGRQAWEMAYVMPDLKTTYGGVDTNNGGFYKMVANTAGDLSSGTLYCALFQSQGAAAQFSISWINLVSTSNAAIATILAQQMGSTATQITFDDIFLVDLPTSNVSGVCNPGFTSVNTAYSYKAANGVTYYNECLQLNPANPNALLMAAVFETARYAGMKGCTLEFSKWEGITFSPRRSQLYAGISYWGSSSGMSPTVSSTGALNNADIGGSKDISIPFVSNYGCGCVFYLNTDSTYNVNSMAPLVCGISLSTPDPVSGSTCSTAGVSAPDNVAMMEDFDTLMIGEDTGFRRTDLIWAYTFPNPPGTLTPDGGSLTPIFSTNYGAETTSPFWFSLGDGTGYVSAVIQHPYGESDNSYAVQPTSSGVGGWIGFIGPIRTDISPASRAAAGAALATAAAVAIVAALL